MKPLDGIQVVDLSLFLPGPMMTMMMADQGADVCRVEPPDGDPSRQMGPFFPNGESVWFRQTNRGKRGVRLDLKSDEGRATLWELVDAADVMVESFRPGTIDRLGFGYAAVRERNPGIVYCSISAFGQTGPWSSQPAHDLGAQALTGFLAVNDGPDGRPVVPGIAASDMAVGLTALAAVTMALLGRAKSGEGTYIDAAMIDSILPWCAHTVGPALLGEGAPESSSQRSLGGSAFYQVYATADDRFVVLCGREMKFVRNLLEAWGRTDLVALADAEPGVAQEPLRAFLSETFAGRTQAEWVEWFHDRDVAFAPVLDFAEALDTDVARDRGLVLEYEDGCREIGPAVRFGHPGIQGESGRAFQK